MNKFLLLSALFIVLAIIVFFVLQQENEPANEKHSEKYATHNLTITQLENVTDGSAERIDTLTTREKVILQRICAENEFVMMSQRVENIYSEKGRKVIANTVIYDSSVLYKEGYLDLNVVFNYSSSAINVSYQYNKGRGAYGYGNLTGNDLDDYIHSLNSCGVTSCIVQTFRGGNKIFEKQFDLP